MKKGQLILHGANQQHALICNENIAPDIVIIGFECYSEHIEKLTYSPLLLTEELQKMLAQIIKEARIVYLPPYDIPNEINMQKRENYLLGADQLIRDYLQIFLIMCLRLRHTLKKAKLPGNKNGESVSLV